MTAAENSDSLQASLGATKTLLAEHVRAAETASGRYQAVIDTMLGGAGVFAETLTRENCPSHPTAVGGIWLIRKGDRYGARQKEFGEYGGQPREHNYEPKWLAVHQSGALAVAAYQDYLVRPGTPQIVHFGDGDSTKYYQSLTPDLFVEPAVGSDEAVATMVIGQWNKDLARATEHYISQRQS